MLQNIESFHLLFLDLTKIMIELDPNVTTHTVLNSIMPINLDLSNQSSINRISIFKVDSCRIYSFSLTNIFTNPSISIFIIDCM